MRFLSTFLAGASCVVSVLAQLTPQIAFTSVPAVVIAGSSYNLSWGGGDSSPATITLRKGDPSNLQTISTLTSDATGDSYVWTVSTSLATASNYALQITQGQYDINYSGLFSLVGGSGSSSITLASTPTAGIVHVNSTSSMSSTSTMNMTSSSTSLGSAASMGTGTAMSRNTTFSSMTLTSSSSSDSLVASATTTATSTAPMSTFSPSSATSTPSSGAAQLTGSVALLLAVFAAVASFQ